MTLKQSQAEPFGTLGETIRASWENHFSDFSTEETVPVVVETPYDDPSNTNCDELFNTNQSKSVRQDPVEQTSLFFHESFTCPIGDCSKVFTTTRSYRLHRVQFHRVSRFTCIVCSGPFHTYKDLVSHMAKETHFIECIICLQSYKKPSEASSHFLLKHRLFRCIHCSIAINGKLQYKNHLLVHADEESALLATSYVETAMNTSFCEYSVESTPKIQDFEVCGAIGTADSPIRLDDDLNPDSHLLSNLDVITYPGNNVATPDAVDLFTNNGCSDTDTAEPEVPSDTESTLENTESEIIPLPLTTSDEPELKFGPGATKLFQDGEDKDDGMQWIGHNVDMYHVVSEKCKEIFKFKCDKCSQTFKTENVLERHKKIHVKVCKHCFLEFDSFTEYKSHIKKHDSSNKSFICSTCNYSLQGLKSLMVHEMRHRLNLAFKRKVEEAVVLNGGHREKSEYHECQVCKELIQGFSHYVRHEIWHNWSCMWTSYVVGRIFQGIFKEEDTIEFRKSVETELMKKWRDCSNDKVESKPDSMEDTQPQIVEHAENATNTDNSIKDKLPKLNNESDTNDNCISENESELSGTEESTSAVNSWMSYWMSYLGLNESPPSWVKPILKNLRLQWKSYCAEDHEDIYRKMDQIGIIVRAEKSEISSLDGPRVVLERLSSSLISQKMSGCLALENSAQSDAKVRQNKRTDASNSHSVNRKRPKTIKARKRTQSARKRTQSARKRTQSALKRTQSARRSPAEQSATISSSSACRVPTEQGQTRPLLLKRILFTDQDNLDVNSSCRKVTRLSQSKTSRQEAECSISSASANPIENLGNMIPNSPVISEKWSSDEEGEIPISTAGSPLSQKECHLGIKRPLVIIPKLSNGSPEFTNSPDVITSTKTVIRSRKDLNNPSTPPPCSFLQMIEWTRKEIGGEPIPMWAVPLVDCISNDLLLSPVDKVNKLRQIVCLIKAHRGDNSSTSAMPVVKLRRAQTAE